MLDDLLRQTEEQCNAALGSPNIAAVLRELDQRGVSRVARLESLRHYWKRTSYPKSSSAAIQQVREKFAEPEQFLVERAMLVDACAASLPKLRELPVFKSVREFMCREFQVYARPPEKWLVHFNPDSYSFRVYCAQALLRRLVAGQLSWVVSGIPPSWLPRMPLRDLPRVLKLIAGELGGFAPLVATHLPVRRTSLLVQLEKEWTKSYYRLARSIERQPEVRGLAASSWLFSEETVRVTPHLAWTRRIFEENGAILVDMGKAAPDSGFLTGSTLRQKLYAEGKYQPRETAVIWPRRAMLQWAHSRPDLDDSCAPA